MICGSLCVIITFLRLRPGLFDLVYGLWQVVSVQLNEIALVLHSAQCH